MNKVSQTVRGALYPIFLLLGLMVMMVLSGTAWSNPAASVHFVSGYVAATAPASAARQLAKGDDLFRSDRVDTEDNGRIQMRFTDGGLVSLMPGSTFTIDEYFHEGGPEEDAALVFGLLRGGLRTVTGTIGQVKHEQYELKTPIATLGIRGTEYIAVIRPANTLRVHVGRGKVVITNDHGTLEVPEGRNAVVTLGSAPEFSDQAPQYQASGPAGDRLVAANQPTQDPHLMDPRANMPTEIPAAMPDVVQHLPSGLYQTAMASFIHIDLSDPSNPSYLGAWDSIYFDFDAAGHPGSSGNQLDTGSWKSFDVVTQGSLSWGSLGAGIGTVNGTTVALGSDQFMPYVVGSTPDVIPQTGTLSYSLAGATPARAYNSDGMLLGTGKLTQFNLLISDLDLSTQNITYSMSVEMLGSATYMGRTYSASGTEPAGISVNSPSFTLSGGTALRDGDVCGFIDCTIDLKGFLAGPNANQAGIVYSIQDGGDTVTGAAGLNRD